MSQQAVVNFQSPVREHRRIVAMLDEPLFAPKMQDRIAAALLERREALPMVRQGQISEALDKLKTEWTSLPGAKENAHRKTADGKPMDMAYLQATLTVQILPNFQFTCPLTPQSQFQFT